MALALEAHDGTLVLEDAHWCHVTLQLPDRHAILGADVRNKVVERLLDGLQDILPRKTAVRTYDLPLQWILSLAENHHSVYGADVAEGRRLLFQDRDARWIAAVTLSPDERWRWISLLQSAA